MDGVLLLFAKSLEVFQKIFFKQADPLAQGSPPPPPTPLAKIFFYKKPPTFQNFLKKSPKNSSVLLRKDESPVAVGNPDQQNAIRSKNSGSPRSLPVGLH